MGNAPCQGRGRAWRHALTTWPGMAPTWKEADPTAARLRRLPRIVSTRGEADQTPRESLLVSRHSGDMHEAGPAKWKGLATRGGLGDRQWEGWPGPRPGQPRGGRRLAELGTIARPGGSAMVPNRPVLWEAITWRGDYTFLASWSFVGESFPLCLKKRPVLGAAFTSQSLHKTRYGTVFKILPPHLIECC